MKTFTLAVTLLAAATVPAAQRPNLLFIYTDDQRYDALSVVQEEQGERGRFPWFKTPNMDRLAREGVRFRNAFVVNSLCAPSRAVNLTGQYSHWNGVASNFRPFPTTNVTHATLLREAGYTTAYVGKWHMDSQRERPGFDRHYTFVGHARYQNPPFIVDGKDIPTEGWIDDISTDYAIQFLKEKATSTKPWLLILGFKSPHGPFTPPPRAQKRFEGEQARNVPNLATPTPYMGAAAVPRTPPAGDRVPVNMDYFRCISAADDCVGRVLATLDELNLATNTLVVYTSDNGFYLGEHGLGDKRSAYDESLRVPFLVRYPALGPAARGRVVDEMVLNLDLAQSLLDFAGVEAPRQMQGRSWRPLLTSSVPAWRQSWFYEYFAEKQRNSRVPDITAVRTRTAKLIKYTDHPEWTELFNLQEDPYETKNLYSDPGSAGLRAQLENEYQRLREQVGYRVPEYTDRPEWWGRPGGPDAVLMRVATNVLWFRPDAFKGNIITDATEAQNHGTAHNVRLAPGRAGKQSLEFNGQAYVEVRRSPRLSPAGSPWTIEVVAKPGKPDGVLAAQGGQTHGYMLWLKEGRPAISVRAESKEVTVIAPERVQDWATIAGVIKANRQVELRVNGKPVASSPLPGFIPANPNDGLSIGADLGSPVLQPIPPRFTGLMESVRVYSGEEKL